MKGKPNLNLAVIGNCQVAALIDDRARIVWACLPRPDGDPVFSALMDKQGGDASRGLFAVDVVDLAHHTHGYLRNTAIVETVLEDSHGGALRVTDFCPRFRARGRMFRPMMLIRMIEPLSGRPVVRLRFRPTAGYGAREAEGRGGSHHLRYAADGARYRLTTDASLHAMSEDRPFVLTRPLTFILGPDESIDEAPGTLARGFLEETRNYWHDWVRTLAVPFDWQEAVIRAAITLKLCTYEDTGAVLAALTTSIPESPGSGRNWDYRYCWLRDSHFTIQALNRLGVTRTMEAYLHFIDDIAAQSAAGDLQPLYRLSGSTDLREQVITTLDGYRGMGPVRIGNQAADQVQHDVYGSVILASTQLFFDQRLTHGGDLGLLERLRPLGERAAALYDVPDAGPWEFRGVQQPHTFSALVCWAGCDRLARIAAHLGLGPMAQSWRTRAQDMREQILARAWNEKRQAFVSSFGGDLLDATGLLLPDFGLLPPEDPRFRSTLDAIGKELREGDWLYRYRHPDDFGHPASAFTVCAFWYVNALAAVGRVDEAREHFSRLLARRNPVGLLSEDIDPRTGELWGNFPQTYSMVGVILSARRLSRSWEDSI